MAQIQGPVIAFVQFDEVPTRYKGTTHQRRWRNFIRWPKGTFSTVLALSRHFGRAAGDTSYLHVRSTAEGGA